MKKMILTLCFLVLFSVSLVGCDSNDVSEEEEEVPHILDGTWTGGVLADGVSITIELNVEDVVVTPSADLISGKGSYIFPEDVLITLRLSGTYELPDIVEFTLVPEALLAHAAIEGTLSADGRVITGRYLEPGFNLPITLRKE
ncbi:MAG: hypothetical protein ACE5G0_16090 [Rhodothermales bacterium]